MGIKTPFIILYLYIWLVNVGPPFFFGMFYILYYSDAMGDTSDFHCVVDISSATKMEKAIPLDYKAAGVSTTGLAAFIEKNPAKYEDVTEKYRGMMLFGMIVQILLFVLSLYQTIRFSPNPEITKDATANALQCVVAVANLTQIIMTLVARCSYAGKICGGDFLPDPPTKEYTKLLPYYEVDDGKFLFATPIVMLVMGPILCCLTMIALPMIILWAIASGM